MSATPHAGVGPTTEVPKQIVDDSKVRGGLQFAYLGEECEYWVFFGHPYHLDVLAAIEIINDEDRVGFEPDELPDAAALDYTYARVLASCPEHGDHDDGCNTCHVISDAKRDGTWLLDWSDAGEDSKANRGKAGYFPIVVWKVDQ